MIFSLQPSAFRHLTAGLLLAGMLLPACGQAQEPLAALLGPPLDGATLDGVRGGFAGNDGLHLNFGLERRIYVNGNLESSTVLYPAGLQAPLTFSPADFTTVLQNSLDHQRLQTLTLLEVRMSGFDPVAFSRFESLKDAQTFNSRR
jgi:hypothetical protein